ncbi:ribosomal protein S10 [Coniophora puteana RWD-64-598 SS2]|uniref:Small ribosomal subunit protein uS10m n=1 Tax=Coniophora puteana (strain RWD-64-598) TaxID=741705 RepID=A0A5M3MFA3_CONPW|nr:ribosomal protein S10 [Coniophora puteana RWD-64-598 SS2]EIW77833.1 ribosomal protein S10 [Coniophora puteana RWD-64-598 SS2]
MLSSLLRARGTVRNVARRIRWNSTQIPAATGASSSSVTPSEPPVSIQTEREYSEAVIHGRSLYPPYQHPKTDGVPVATLHVRGHQPRLLELFLHFAGHAASALGIPCSRPASLPTQRSLWTVPTSPFIYKKSQENFERRVHKRAIKMWDADPEVVDRWVRYIQHHAMPGVGMRITRWERMPVGVGKLMDAAASAQIRPSAKVQALADQIVQQEMIADRAAQTETQVEAPKAESVPKPSTPQETQSSPKS